jgi:uncharacterized protein (DUF488 family)
VTAVATIGFGQKSAERLVGLLTEAGVTTVVDIRRRPDSPLSGYARKRDLPFLLDAAAGIGYAHRLELAPPEELLLRYRTDRDWPAYIADFTELVLDTAEAEAEMRELLARPELVALLCSEPGPERCHRRLVAERMATLGAVEIVHLAAHA